MAIPMQGSWTVSVKAKNADFPQRFIIAGADSGNGTYAGALSTSPVLVTGAHWRIQIQNDPGGGEDFNDLILTCSTPVTATDFVVYGNARSYSGRCFLPCLRHWLIIDTDLTLRHALTYPPIRKALEKLYPDRVRIKPIPRPAPPPFIPMVIPLIDNQLIPEKRVQLIRLPQQQELTREVKSADSSDN